MGRWAAVNLQIAQASSSPRYVASGRARGGRRVCRGRRRDRGVMTGPPVDQLAKPVYRRKARSRGGKVRGERQRQLTACTSASQLTRRLSERLFPSSVSFALTWRARGTIACTDSGTLPTTSDIVADGCKHSDRAQSGARGARGHVLRVPDAPRPADVAPACHPPGLGRRERCPHRPQNATCSARGPLRASVDLRAQQRPEFE